MPRRPLLTPRHRDPRGERWSGREMSREAGYGVTVQSPAKINWTLRVVGRRPDGYHEIESLVSAVSLCDELVFTDRPDAAIELRCDQPGVPTDDRNLVVRAAKLLASDAGRTAGVTCRLTKRIPTGGGLGGGSSNGATALKTLNRLWKLDWPLDRLAPLAAMLGSDVPFFLTGGSAIMSGRGEHIRPIRLGWRGWIVLIMPGIAVSTADVYRAWTPGADEMPRGELAPEASLPADALEWMGRTYNMLERPAVRVCPSLGVLLDDARRRAGREVRMSGSGSTMFTAFDDADEAEQVAAGMRDALNVATCVVRPVEGQGVQGQASRGA